ncbi:hypothetical protein I302_104767 [Kwoniella bestiolae CBS 10118]|uniref:rRNA-processing protein FYV7 n=1 Tax=Kwoniella bestiolae CBS 10118 TaxID=1296100 RepID=A0A1B9FRT8_9TREE|nr:hypothetical protein I302_09163 [Kwoniella bestiolae CBS 10118]OCF21484.1 hypothetical protein I302_09163 [Kwoniella bestiolae CBS 10118]
MLRITKKQKEAGKTAKPKPKARSGGFQVKPSRAPKDAYMGKAQKIKADLIQRAKMKKSYAKVLKAEGMDSGRLGDGSRRRNERPSESEQQQRGRGKGKGRAENENEGVIDEEQRRLEARAGPAPGSGSGPSRPFKMNKSRSNGSLRDRDRSPHQPRQPSPPKKIRALSISPPPPPSSTAQPVLGEKKSFREMKKEAFSKYHRPREQASMSISGNGTGRGNKRGQPNMNARMGLLLEKIKGNVE